MVDKKELKEMFRDFLFNIETFIESSALKMDKDIAVFTVYLQEPQEFDGEIYARGLILVGRHATPIEVHYIVDFDDIEIKSKFFKYHLTSEQMKEFLAQIHGGAEE